MNAGELKENVDILTLVQSGTEWLWNDTADAYAKAEPSDKKNYFSTVGMGAGTVKFTIRPRVLTLHNAVQWKGRHCFLTDIVKTQDKRHLEITAAFVEPRVCSVKRTVTTVDPVLKRPVESAPQLLSFPGCLTEKYLGRIQTEPMNVNETRLILVTPKVIELEAGEVVTVAGFEQPFTVLIPHTLDAYKNEYEITRREEI